MRPATVDAYVRAKVQPEFRRIVMKIRGLMREYKPDITEVMSYAMPCYRAKGILAYIIPNKTGITLGFPHGKKMSDRYGLLCGAGKSSRYLRLRTEADIDKTILSYYLKQALVDDAKRDHASSRGER